MRNIGKNLLAFILIGTMALSTSTLSAYAEESFLHYIDTPPIVSESVETENPNLYALATECGYDTDTFQFVNFVPVDVMSEDAVGEVSNRYLDIITFEEETHKGAINFISAVASGCCYGLSALSVLVHNGYIQPSDIQEDAVTLNDIVFDEEVGKIIVSYAASQVYHEVQLANYKHASLKTNEDYVAELLEYGERSNETSEYFVIAYSGIRDEQAFGHAVTGIGMAEGLWSYNDITYDKCVLTYDSNCTNKDTGMAGGFTDALCIYVNSKTMQFCIPGYGFSTENGSSLDYVTNAAKRLNYRGMINGSNVIGEDISDAVKMNFYSSRTNGLEVTAITDDGESFDVNEKIETVFSGMWGNRFYLFNAHNYHIEQNKGVEYSIEYSGEASSYGKATSIDSSTWGQYYTTRYGADNNYNYIIDVTPSKVSVTNTKAAPGFENKEMWLECSLSYPDDYYFLYLATAEEGETISIDDAENGMIISSDEGTLKGTLLIKSTTKDAPLVGETLLNGESASYISLPISITDSAYITIEDGVAVIYLDLNKDGVYEFPMEKGDANGDGKIDLLDASVVLSYFAEDCVGMTETAQLNKFYPLSIHSADLDGDEKISLSDATEILSKYAKRAAGLE